MATGAVGGAGGRNWFDFTRFIFLLTAGLILCYTGCIDRNHEY